MIVRPVRWLALLLAASLAAFGCAPRLVETGIGADPQLVALTSELISEPAPDDQATLRLVFTEQNQSISDMSTMSVAQFKKAHGRGPSDQATLMGRWLGRASRVVSGPLITAQIRQSLQDATITA